MTKKIVWRLKEQPTAESLQGLVKDGILTKDEAREILFSSETIEDRDKKSLESEIKFLRELVEKLSNNSRTEIIEKIQYIERPYRRWDWYEPYKFYCTTGTQMLAGDTITTDNQVMSNVDFDNMNVEKFSQIKTF